MCPEGGWSCALRERMVINHWRGGPLTVSKTLLTVPTTRGGLGHSIWRRTGA